LTQRGRRTFGRYAIAGVGAAVGLLLLVLGAAGGRAWLGVVGFVVMFAAVAFAFADPHRGRKSGPQGTVQPSGAVRKPAPKKQGLMSRLEERWERRRGESGR
jgi:hypothetical protein